MNAMQLDDTETIIADEFKGARHSLRKLMVECAERRVSNGILNTLQHLIATRLANRFGDLVEAEDAPDRLDDENFELPPFCYFCGQDQSDCPDGAPTVHLFERYHHSFVVDAPPQIPF